MNKRIVFDNGSGGVNILTPAPGARRKDESDTDFLSRLAAKDVPAGVPFNIVDAAAIPTDRYFRNAWKPDLSIDMVKARDVHRDKLRALREPLLAALDIEYQRADELGDAVSKVKIAARKKVLRDITDDPRIEAAMTPDQLRTVTLPA